MKRALVVVAMIVLLIAALPPLAADEHVPTAPASDLQVGSIAIVGGTAPEWIHGAPTPAVSQVQVVLRNDGDAPAVGYRLDFHWVQDNVVTWLNGDESTSFDISEGTVGANAVRTHRDVPWRLQPGQEGAGKLRVVVWPHGSTDKAQADLDLFVNVHDLEFSVPAAGQTILAGETRFIRAQVINRGNVNETVTLNHTGHEPIGQIQSDDGPRLGDISTLLQYTNLTVAPNSTGLSTLFFTYTYSGNPAEFRFWFDLQMESAYGVNQTAMTPLFNATTNGTLGPGSLVEIRRGDAFPLTVPANGTTTREFIVKNEGNTSDTYRITPVPATGWQAEVALAGLPFNVSQRVALDPGQEARFQLLVAPPEDAVAGEPADISLRVRSDRPTGLLERTFQFRVGGPSLHLAPASAWPSIAYVGDRAAGALVLQNDGDDLVPANVTLLVNASGSLVASVAVPVPRLAGGASALVPFVVGNYTHGGPVTYTVGLVQANATHHATGLERILFIHDAKATIDAPAPLAGAPGERVGYRAGDHLFKVRNDGNAVETYRATVTSTDAVIEFTMDPVFTLAPGGSKSLPFDLWVPDPSGTLLTIESVLEVAIEGRPDLAWTANITTTIEDVTPPTVKADAPPKLWAYGATLPLRLTATDDAAVASAAVVHIAPNGAQTVTVMAAEGADGWQKRITLDKIGEHTLYFSVSDVHGNVATTPASLVTVQDVTPPSIELIGPLEGESVIADVAFRVQVTDVRPIEKVTAKVSDPQGVALWERELEIIDGEGVFNLTDTPAGTVTVIVEAVNQAGAAGAIVRNVTILPLVDDEGPVDFQDYGETTPAPAPWLVLLAALLLGLRRRAGRMDDPRGGRS